MTTETQTPPLPSTPAFRPRTQEPPSANRRNGKIARLPKSTRDMINRMLDDGLPYHVIIEEIHDSTDPALQCSISVQNLTNWKQGGYQDWLKDQLVIERTRMQMEFAADLLEPAGPDPGLIHQACNVVAALQMFTAILEHGDEALRLILVDKPAAYLSVLNAICRIADSGLKIDKHRADMAERGVQSSSLCTCTAHAG